jgi:hypothetical protein
MRYLFCKLEPPVGATFRVAAAVLLLPGLGMWQEEGPRIRRSLFCDGAAPDVQSRGLIQTISG